MKRSGADMCGVNGLESAKFSSTKNTKFDPATRGQSNAEHTFLVLALNKLMFDNYRVYDFDHNAFIRADRAISQHEAGENLLGDIPDDGTRPKNIDDIEKDYIKTNYWCYLSPNVGCLLESLHSDMEDGRNGFGVYCKMNDKFAYIDDLLCWQGMGRIGDLRIKDEYFELSENDKKAIEYTGTYNVVDVSLYSTLEGHKEFFTHPYFKYFIEVVQSGAVVVRGAEIEWLHRYIAAI